MALLAFTLELRPFVFFVWLSVFNLFVVSVFWSFMSDIFDSGQAARLYGTIAAGGSCGAIAGPCRWRGAPSRCSSALK
jgi:AAA family ATP:ADP antiporter